MGMTRSTRSYGPSTVSLTAWADWDMRAHVDSPQCAAISETNRWYMPVAASYAGGPPPQDETALVLVQPSERGRRASERSVRVCWCARACANRHSREPPELRGMCAAGWLFGAGGLERPGRTGEERVGILTGHVRRRVQVERIAGCPRPPLITSAPAARRVARAVERAAQVGGAARRRRGGSSRRGPNNNRQHKKQGHLFSNDLLPEFDIPGTGGGRRQLRDRTSAHQRNTPGPPSAGQPLGATTTPAKPAAHVHLAVKQTI